MARLRRQSPSGAERYNESDYCPSDRDAIKDRPSKNATAALRSSPRKKAPKSYVDAEVVVPDAPESGDNLICKVKPKTQPQGRQIRLAPFGGLPSSTAIASIHSTDSELLRERGSENTKHSIRKGLVLQSNVSKRSVASEISFSSNASVEVEVEESVWCGSNESSDDSEEELPSPRKFLHFPRREPDKNFAAEASDPYSRDRDWPPTVTKEPKSSIENTKRLYSTSIVSSRPASSSDKENQAAFLRFSPPRLHTRTKRQSCERPITPPQSPSKSRLQSPSKTKTRVPTPTLRQSLDAFWSSNAINDWNDQYSPQKVLKSPKKLKFLRDDAITSPSASPRKPQSPSKATRAEREAKKDFESRKRRLAEDFLVELDGSVTDGQIKELAAATGGVHFIWSKTLNSTAGRANWRKETTKVRKMDGTVDITHKHHASIELAEKVINDEDRLLNVIAHEFCHLANFMISGIKDQPHGRQFKEWGRKCTKAFEHRGVEVTTKHSYQIEYKYIWQCSNEDCAVEFKRHSKSIDPKRHTCGTCRSTLVQIKPVPRRDAGNGTGYAVFVKMHFADVKRSMPGASQKEVMEAIGWKYRAEKAATNGAPVEENLTPPNVEGSAVNELIDGLEVITLDDD